MEKSAIIFSLILIASLLLSCASTTPPTIFLPQQDQQVMSFYRNGLPIGAINTDSSFMMISLEPADVSHTKYMRLWLLYKNNSSVPFLLEPLKAVTLTILGEKKNYDDITPESPTKILANIENEKATSLIVQAIGGSLQAMAAQPTTITNQSGEEWKVNDKPNKVRGITKETNANMSSTAVYYDIFKNSINAGIMRRNTIFQGESVNGYIYFRLPEHDAGNLNRAYINSSNYNYKLEIFTPNGNKIVEFTPSVGE